MHRALVLLVVVALALTAPDAAGATDALWELLRAGGQVVVMRHAATDRSIGDPPNFRLDDCATQRNLADAGREEARRVGAAFRGRAIPIGRVLSSQWCRCLEPARTREVRALVSARPERGNLVLVTHQFNIGALTGVYPAEGELLVLTPLANGEFRVAGRMKP